MLQRHDHEEGVTLSVRIPGKVNLFLAVRGVRDDGYHELTTVMQTVSVYDELSARLAGPPGRVHHPATRRRMLLQVKTRPGQGVPEGEANLAARAARVLGPRAGIMAPNGEMDCPTTVLDVDKTIPVAGGMAGGSADAAASLVALNRLWGCELSRDELRELAGEVGSDVPFCVVGGTALATGRGTELAQVLCRGAFHWIVATSRESLSTAAVYRMWDGRCAPTEVEPDAVLQALRAEDAEALGAALHNELEPAAFHLRPELAKAKQGLLDAGALGAVLSGSGPTLLAIAADAASAEDLAEAVRERFNRVLVTRSPAGGPEFSQR